MLHCAAGWLMINRDYKLVCGCSPPMEHLWVLLCRLFWVIRLKKN